MSRKPQADLFRLIVARRSVGRGSIGACHIAKAGFKRFYLKPDGTVYSVTDEVRMQDFKRPPATAAAPPAMPQVRQ